MCLYEWKMILFYHAYDMWYTFLCFPSFPLRRTKDLNFSVPSERRERQEGDKEKKVVRERCQEGNWVGSFGKKIYGLSYRRHGGPMSLRRRFGAPKDSPLYMLFFLRHPQWTARAPNYSSSRFPLHQTPIGSPPQIPLLLLQPGRKRKRHI